eukprot:TRINITY_DN29215_c1_g1_i1.p1 TRINITY_DN29215_c1_g1~~TRINITY_DN29215_c1_g1_i1.p1  ORF type:complete len:332 (-),score=19.37 TRINITY_DN29215_c1_g1_i1:344-1339(-)
MHVCCKLSEFALLELMTFFKQNCLFTYNNFFKIQTGVKGLSNNLQELSDSFQSVTHKWLNELGHHVQKEFHQHTEQLVMRVQWPTAKWPMYMFTFGACLCMLTSSACHLFGCCSQHIAQLIWRFDYAGIAILIVSSFAPLVCYGFQCQPFWRDLYLIVTALLGVGTFAVSLLNIFQTPKWHYFRATVFMALGLWGIVPGVHWLFIHSHVWQMRQVLVYELLMGAFYLSGAYVYATRIPERWRPGKFDILFNSHQIFHIVVVLGACAHFKAGMLMIQWRDASGGCAFPLVSGPVQSVLEDLQMKGQLFSLQQMWEGLIERVNEFLMNCGHRC